jgi:glycosyltransferase involved in cell wall biosynthesis
MAQRPVQNKETVAPHEGQAGPHSSNSLIDVRVVLLTNFIPPYQVPVYEELAGAYREFHVLISTAMEPNRQFEQEWGSLDVTVQKTLTLHQTWKHKAGGFEDTLYVHFPLDTGRLLRKLKPDIILSGELGFRSLACALYRRLHSSTRLILFTHMSTHSEQNRGLIRLFLRKWLVRQADAITYNGPECRGILQNLGARRDKLFEFGYAAHPAHVDKDPLDHNTLVGRRLLYIGQLSERKGVIQMLDALVLFASTHSQRQFHVSIVGEGPQRSTLTTLNIPDNLHVEFKNHVPVGKLPALIREHGVLIFPTLADEWGLVVNEALHAGLPVIGSTMAQSVTSLIKDGQNGWRFDPRLPSEWSKALNNYFDTSDSELVSMSARSVMSASHLTPENACRGLLQACLYADTLPNDE